jgi:hypothetical protein
MRAVDAVTNRQLVAVSWSMPPALFPRSIQVARLLKGLHGLGWSSTVVTLDEANRGKGDPMDPALSEIYSPFYQTEQVSAGNASKGPRSPWLRWKIGKQLPIDAHWALAAAAAARQAVQRDGAEVLVTFAQPWRDHYAGLMYGRPRVPWVAHFSDPWVDSLYYRDMYGIERDRDLRCEAAIMREADLVVFTNEYAADLVMHKYPKPWRAKARVVGHATDGDLLGIVDQMPSTRPANGVLRLSYVGALLADRRTLDDLLLALARLNARDELQGRLELEVIGSGSGTESARQKVFELGLEPLVTFQPPVMYLESLRVMRDSDVLVLIDARARTNVFLPSKLVDYLLADRAILGITPLAGASADLVRSCGYPMVEPGNIDGITDAVSALLARHESGVPALTAPQGALQRYSLDSVAKAFAEVLDEAIAGFSWARRWV